MSHNIEERILDFFEGTLDQKSQTKLLEEIQKDPQAKKIFKDYQSLYQGLSETPIERPSPQLKQNFQIWLQDQQGKQIQQTKPSSLKPLFKWQWAAAVALLIIGGSYGLLWKSYRNQNEQIQYLASEVQETRKMLALSRLEQNSASQRIKAMHELPTQTSIIDPEIVEAVAHTLLTDNNVNVRVTAAEALGVFSKSETVQDFLIEALKKEDNPQVQISIIGILVNLQTQKAIPHLQELLVQEKTAPFVKEQAQKGIEILL